MRPPVNKGSNIAKNRSCAFEMKSYLKNDPVSKVMAILADKFVNTSTHEEISFSISPADFEIEACRIFKLRKS